MTEREEIILALDAGIPADKITVRDALLLEIRRCRLCDEDSHGICWAVHRRLVRNCGLTVENINEGRR